jgi:hypothetical protein
MGRKKEQQQNDVRKIKSRYEVFICSIKLNSDL